MGSRDRALLGIRHIRGHRLRRDGAFGCRPLATLEAATAHDRWLADLKSRRRLGIRPIDP
jgi:hypothetical protein